MDKPVFDKGLVLPDKLICLSKTHVSNAWGLPRGMLMPSPRGHDKIANAQPLGLTTWANAPQLPGGGGVGGIGTAGIDWCINSKFREVYENYIFWYGAFQSVSFGFRLLVVKKVMVETACMQLQW